VWPRLPLRDPLNAPAESDRARVEHLLTEHRDALFRFVRGRLGDSAAADDVVQQVSLRAFQHVSGLRDAAAGRAWLFRIARNALADLHGRRALEPVPTAAETLNEMVGGLVPEDDAPTCRCILKQAGDLKAEYASLLSAVVVEGRPIVQVAAELGISANNATVRLHRARAALKQRLVEHCGTESVRACLNCSCDERRCCGDA
jgi:RNA polymerase sigma factor (sigma-70 family)